MLLSMSEYYNVRCGYNSKCTKLCKFEINKVDSTEFCKCKGLCGTWKDISKTVFGENELQQLKRRRQLHFADFFLSYDIYIYIYMIHDIYIYIYISCFCSSFVFM